VETGAPGLKPFIPARRPARPAARPEDENTCTDKHLAADPDRWTSSPEAWRSWATAWHGPPAWIAGRIGVRIAVRRPPPAAPIRRPQRSQSAQVRPHAVV